MTTIPTAERMRSAVRDIIPVRGRPWAAALGLITVSVGTDGSPEMVIPLGVALGGLALFELDRRRRAQDIPTAARRLRRTLAIGAAYGGWLAGASFVDWSGDGPGIVVATTALFGATLVRHLVAERRRARPLTPHMPLAIEAGPADDAQAYVSGLCDTWSRRITPAQGPLRGTVLEAVHPVRIDGRLVGWQGAFGLESDTSDPSRVDDGGARVAWAYRCGMDRVSVTLDPMDASRGRVLVLKHNTLRAPIPWTGDGIDANGRAVIGQYMGGDSAWYRFWDSAGVWHDLIAGSTGSGKSETVNLVLAMEIQHPLVASYLIDPQHGQSYGELTDYMAETAYDLDSARDLVARLEGEMYARNAIMRQMRWTDSRGRRRRGVKSWRPTATMKMLSLTIDECHVYLSDEQFRNCVTRILAMGRKCGIRVRLVTQVPLLSSLGGRMEIRDAVASGNVIVLRTANALSGTVAANGNLPGQPNKLPREWPQSEADRRAGIEPESAAGVCYLAGAGAVPEMARCAYSDDLYGLLFTDEGEMLYPLERPTLAEAYVPDNKTPDQLINERDGRGVTARDRVLMYMRARVGEDVQLSDMMADLAPIAERSIMYALAHLTAVENGELVTKAQRGRYRLNEGAAMEKTSALI